MESLEPNIFKTCNDHVLTRMHSHKHQWHPDKKEGVDITA